MNVESFKPPKFNFFDCDINHFNWILEPFSSKDKNRFQAFCECDSNEKKHKTTQFKSFDCSIMDLADDIANGVHDLEDAIALKLVTRKDWEEKINPNIEYCIQGYKSIKGTIADDLFFGENKIRKSAISYLVHFFIIHIEIEKRSFFHDELLDLKATLPKHLNKELKTLKDFIYENIIKTPEVQTLEYKGQQIIVKLFEAIANNPIMLEKKHYKKYKEQSEEKDRLRVICDFIAGDTDEYATRLYHKIFTPSIGSVFDRL